MNTNWIKRKKLKRSNNRFEHLTKKLFHLVFVKDKSDHDAYARWITCFNHHILFQIFPRWVPFPIFLYQLKFCDSGYELLPTNLDCYPFVVFFFFSEILKWLGGNELSKECLAWETMAPIYITFHVRISIFEMRFISEAYHSQTHKCFQHLSDNHISGKCKI